MSVEMQHLAINYIALTDSGEHQAHYREALIGRSGAVANLVEQLHLAYNGKPAKGYAAFETEKSPKVALALADWQSGNSDYLGFSRATTDALVQELSQHQLPETGYLLLAHYRYLASEFLLICLLGSKDHFELTEQLELATSRHLDISRMQLAARLDLTEYAVNREQGHYISFIRGRAGRKVADFFLDFLGCAEGTDAKANSQLVLASVEEYLGAAEFAPEEKTAARRQVFDYCEERAKAGQEVVLAELSAVVDPEQENGFLHYCAEQQLAVAEQFPVEVKELKKLVKFNGTGGGLSLSFDEKLLGERVSYDLKTDTLVIKGTPPNLRDQLQRFLQGYSAFEQQGD
ncbi:nucleoid-associated protein NdpA [Alishewanella agri BL06]|jgi:nucleoid-associated protein|uniref:Nucleoid-associated protein NdpA n=1 Tax=Alishewanella agri BL06 TaxID=1195246 RepID=I9P5S6_9ALTE|nr:nucleoid-associated protein YejK [Alishewanella agri]EIW90189.1 nucleoid-associated protein NdpA [Alishewanella agri BL06]